MSPWCTSVSLLTCVLERLESVVTRSGSAGMGVGKGKPGPMVGVPSVACVGRPGRVANAWIGACKFLMGLVLSVLKHVRVAVTVRPYTLGQ